MPFCCIKFFAKNQKKCLHSNAINDILFSATKRNRVIKTFKEKGNEQNGAGNEQEMSRMSILSPLDGRVIPLEEVPDEVFAEKVLGDGAAVILQPAGRRDCRHSGEPACLRHPFRRRN